MEHKKQSEIGLAQNLISKLAQLPWGQTFSLAALHTQTATVQAIVAAGHHCLIAVKQNQPTLGRTIESTAQTQTAVSHASVLDSSYGRIVPQALRLWANQVDDVFSFLVWNHPESCNERGWGWGLIRDFSNSLLGISRMSTNV